MLSNVKCQIDLDQSVSKVQLRVTAEYNGRIGADDLAIFGPPGRRRRRRRRPRARSVRAGAAAAVGLYCAV
jgi:hypothetical protein